MLLWKFPVKSSNSKLCGPIFTKYLSFGRVFFYLSVQRSLCYTNDPCDQRLIIVDSVAFPANMLFIITRIEDFSFNFFRVYFRQNTKGQRLLYKLYVNSISIMYICGLKSITYITKFYYKTSKTNTIPINNAYEHKDVKNQIYSGKRYTLKKIWRTYLTICLCLSTQYLMALRTSISCFFVNPFGPTLPLKVIPAVGRKVAVKSVLLLYIPRRSMSNMFSPGAVGVVGGSGSWSLGCSALPAWIGNKWILEAAIGTLKNQINQLQFLRIS